MRILVTFAVEAEFAPWRRLRSLAHRKVDGLDIYQAQIGRAAVDFVVTGMGIKRAEDAAAVAISSTPHQVCVTAGFAGALKDQHSVGHLLAAHCVQNLADGKTLQCSRNLVHAAARDGAKQVKAFLTSDHVVRTSEEKSRLAPFADAVEMESFGVMSAAKEHHLPCVAIRVISDSLTSDMPVNIDTMIDARGRLSVHGVVKYVVYHPVQLPALLRLGRDSRTAADALAHFLEAYIKSVSLFSHGWFPEGEGLEEVATR